MHLFYLKYKILNFKIYIKTFLYSHSYKFRSVQTIIRESIPSLAKVNFVDTISKSKSNFSQAQFGLPNDGLYGPKLVGVTVKKYFNVNFNI